MKDGIGISVIWPRNNNVRNSPVNGKNTEEYTATQDQIKPLVDKSDFCYQDVWYATCTASRCHYTKSNPIDDHTNISSKTLQKQNFKPLGHYTCMQCGTSHLQTVQENVLSHIIFSDLQEVYSGNRQIHTKCQLQYFHPPHISTSGKCHCVIIHQRTKATEYIG